MLDTVIQAETPEGMPLELRPAGLSPRFHALLIDWMIRGAILSVLANPLVLLGGLGVALFFIVTFALEWGYPIVFELAWNGATPGKRLLGLRVVMDDGLPVTLTASIVRNLLRAADFLPLGFGAAIVSMLWRADHKRLGDIAAATMVVHAAPRQSGSPVSDVPPRPPAMALSVATQSAVVALAARAATLTPARLDELAALAAPASGDTGRSGPQVTTRVLGVAQWLVGRRP